VLTTDADRLREQYKQSGEAQHRGFGEGFVAPDFTKIPGIRASTPAATTPAPPSGTQPSRDRQEAQPKPASAAADAPAKASVPSTASAPAPPKPKPRPTAPILVTDPTDADPDAVPPPSAPKTEKPAKPPGVPPTRPPSGNQ
jgi:hypothetical protein